MDGRTSSGRVPMPSAGRCDRPIASLRKRRLRLRSANGRPYRWAHTAAISPRVVGGVRQRGLSASALRYLLQGFAIRRAAEPRIGKGILLDLAKGRGVWSQDGSLSKRIQTTCCRLLEVRRAGKGANAFRPNATWRERALQGHTQRPATVLNTSCGILDDESSPAVQSPHCARGG